MDQVQEVLRLATPTLRDVAEAVDVPYETVRSWKAGKRSPSVEAVGKLRRFLMRRAARLYHEACRLSPRDELNPRIGMKAADWSASYEVAVRDATRKMLTSSAADEIRRLTDEMYRIRNTPAEFTEPDV